MWKKKDQKVQNLTPVTDNSNFKNPYINLGREKEAAVAKSGSKKNSR